MDKSCPNKECPAFRSDLRALNQKLTLLHHRITGKTTPTALKEKTLRRDIRRSKKAQEKEREAEEAAQRQLDLVKAKDAEITTLKGQVAQHVSEIETLKERVTHLAGWVQTQCGINDRNLMNITRLQQRLQRANLRFDLD